MQGQHNVRVTDAQFNEIFTRNHGAEEAAYYADQPSARDMDITATFLALTERHTYGKSKPSHGMDGPAIEDGGCE